MGEIAHTGKVLTEPMQDSFLSFKVIVSHLFSIYSLLSPISSPFTLPLPPRPFLLCLSSRYPPFGLLGLHPHWTHHSSPAGGSSLRGLARPSPTPKGLRPRCPRWCLIRAELSPNPLPHSAHLYGFSPVCVRLCLTRSELRGNSFPQKPHTWGWLGPVSWART